MDQHGKNKLKMYKAVQVICTAHEPEWNTVPAFANAVMSFDDKLLALEQAIYKQSFATAGITATKDQLFETTVGRAEIMLQALKVYAMDHNNTLLAEQLNITKRDFRSGGSRAVLNLIDRILNLALENAAALEDYAIEQQNINDLETARNELAVAFGNPRSAIIDRKQETQTINDCISELDHLLRDHLDRLIEVLKTAHPAFYKRFRDARIIVDYKGKKNDHGDAPDPDLGGNPGDEGTR